MPIIQLHTNLCDHFRVNRVAMAVGAMSKTNTKKIPAIGTALTTTMPKEI